MLVRRIQGLMYDGEPDPGAPAPVLEPEPKADPAPILSDDGKPLLGDDSTVTPKVEASVEVQYEKFELKMPDNSKVSTERASTILAEAKEQGLPPSVAQKLVDNEHSAVAEYEAAQGESLKSSRAEWIETLKKDPAWGGEKWNETVQLAKRGLEAHGDDEMKKFLGSSGLGDHHAVIKHFARLGKLAAEDTLVRTGVKTKDGGDRNLADILYPSTAGKG